MASLVSFDHFVKTGDSRSETCHQHSGLSTTNSETGDPGVDGYPLYMGHLPTLMTESQESVTYERRSNSETGE